jgi:hypothetical protein
MRWLKMEAVVFEAHEAEGALSTNAVWKIWRSTEEQLRQVLTHE